MTQHSTIPEGLSLEAPINIKEASQRLGVSVRYMRRMVDEKRVRYLKVGRLIRFRGSDLDAYLKRAEVEAVVTSADLIS